MAVDNDVYNRIGQSWWADDNPLVLLHGTMTTGRVDYFRDVLARLGRLPTGGERPRAVDVGSGGGFLAEEFAKLGFAVTGVDPSPVSIATARKHAMEHDLDIEYLVGAGEGLPVEDGRFSVAYCCDVLEHVRDVDRVLAEIARAVEPNGVLLFDTLNKTVTSKLITKAMQDWRLTRLVDFDLHDWGMFLPPGELAARMEHCGLRMHETVGLGPRANPLSAVKGLADLKRHRITYRELSTRLDFGRMRSKAVSYMGYARRV